MEISQSHLGQDLAYERPLLACRFSPNGKFIATSSEDSTIPYWNLASGEKVVCKGHNSWVHALAFTPDGTQLISGGCDGRLIWWSLAEATPQPIRSIDAHFGWIRAIDISPDGSHLVSVGNDLVVRRWQVSTGEKLSQWDGHEKHIYSVLNHPKQPQLVTGDLAGKIHLWDVPSGKVIRTLDATPLHTYEGGQRVDFGGVRALSLSTDQSQLIAGGLHKATNPLGAVHEPLVMRFKLETGELLKSHVCDGITGGVIWRLFTLADDTTVAVCGGSSGGFLLFFRQDQEKEIFRFKLPSLARDMDVHAASERVCTIHYDQHLRITHLHPKPAVP